MATTVLPAKQRAMDWGHEALEKGIDWILRLNHTAEATLVGSIHSNVNNNEEEQENDGMELHQLRDARSAQKMNSSTTRERFNTSDGKSVHKNLFNEDNDESCRGRRKSIVLEINDEDLDDLELEEEDEPELLTAVTPGYDGALSDDEVHHEDREDEELTIPPQPIGDDDDLVETRKRRNVTSKNIRRQVSSQYSGVHQSIDEDSIPSGDHYGGIDDDNEHDEFGIVIDETQQTKAQRHFWLLGGWSATQARPWELVDGPWAPRLYVTSPALQVGELTPEERAQHEVLSSRRRRGSSCALATDFAEGVALVGGRDGVVRLWSLREPPGRLGPPVTLRNERHARRVRSLFCLDGATSGVSSDGTRFDVWDLESGETVRKWVWAVPFGVSSERLVDVSPIPLGYGALFPGAGGPQQVAALAERALSLVDVRGTGRSAVTEFLISFALPRGSTFSLSALGAFPPSSGTNHEFIRAEEQGIDNEPIEEVPHTPRGNLVASSAALNSPIAATPPRTQRSLHNTTTSCRPMQQQIQPPPETSLYRDDVDAAAAARCVVSIGDGRCLALGSESGRIALLDRRAGRVLCVWSAHAPGVVVVKLIACSQNQLLSLGSDRVATLWNLQFATPSHTPEALASTRLDVRGPLLPHNIQALRFDDATTLLAAASGHKLAVARFADAYVRSPLSEASVAAANGRTATSVLAHRRHFVDDRGQRLHRNQLHIEALHFLSLRRALLLGCDDGTVRVAV